MTVIQEVIQHAKANHKTVHITWFDLEDAFGSVSHVLISYVMSHYHIPAQIIRYITNQYSKLNGYIHCSEWKRDIFRFLKGVFQGDPFSGVILLIVFISIIEYIKQHKEKQGYELKTSTCVKPVNTTPFSDDFNVI